MSTEPDHLLDKLKKLPSDLRLFVEKRLELFMIESGERLASVMANAATVLVTGLIAVLGLVFALLSFSYFLSEVLDSKPLGFGITASLIFVVALLIYLAAPDAIESRVRAKIARQLMEHERNHSETSGASNSSTSNESSKNTSKRDPETYTESPPGYSGPATTRTTSKSND